MIKKNSKANRRQEITKIGAELKEIETHTKNKPFKKSINQGAGFLKRSTKQTTSQINKKEKGEESNICNKKTIKWISPLTPQTYKLP